MLIQFTPIIILYFTASAISLSLAFRTWQMRATRGAVFWAFTMFFAAIFALGTGLETMMVAPKWKYAMISVVYLGVTGLTFFWGLFCVTYSHYQKWLNRFTVSLLAIIPLVVFILTIGVDRHNLIYEDYEFITFDGLVISQVNAYGVAFWIWAAYSYLNLLGGSILLIQAVMRFPELFRGQVRLLVLSVTIPVIANAFYIFDFNPIEPFDPTPLSITLSGIFMLFAMSRYHFLDVIPIAHDVIFNNVESAIIIIDLKDRVVNMNNAAERILKPTHNVIGKSSRDVFWTYPEIRASLQDEMEVETEIVIADKVYALQASPIKDRHGILAGRTVMLYDITERIEMEQQKVELVVERERIEFLEKFISDASHDLKTPLANMKTHHFLLRRELSGKALERLDILEGKTSYLINLVDDMLLMVRLDAHELSEASRFNLDSLIKNCLEKYRSSETATIEYYPTEKLPIIRGNEREIDQALSHLMNNALRYTPQDGKVTIRTSCGENYVVISVADTGIGIAESEFDKIFQRFYRINQARTSGEGSSGLGLAIVKRIIERHSGKIEVRSIVGEGSEFRVFLPISKEDVSHSENKPEVEHFV